MSDVMMEHNTDAADEARKKINWQEAYDSPEFQKIKKKRLVFIIPAVILVFFLFFILFWVQSFNPALATKAVAGDANFAFVYSMLIFPIVWISGMLYILYVRKTIYPIEDKIQEKYTIAKEE